MTDETIEVHVPVSIVVLTSKHDNKWRVCTCQINQDAIADEGRIIPKKLGHCNHWLERLPRPVRST